MNGPHFTELTREEGFVDIPNAQFEEVKTLEILFLALVWNQKIILNSRVEKVIFIFQNLNTILLIWKRTPQKSTKN